MPLETSETTDSAERSAIHYAFVAPAGSEAELAELKELSSNTLLNQSGAELRPLNGKALQIGDYVRDQVRVVLPVYNQEHTIGRTIDYLVSQVGIPHEHIVAASASTDTSDQILHAKDIPVLRQEETLREMLDMDRFLGLMHANDLGQLRGKGLTMFTAHAHDVLHRCNSADSFVLQIDTDIDNIGTGAGQWDPATYFAHYLAQDSSIDAAKASKAGRNNQPIHIGLNTLPSLNAELGRHYQQVNMDRWILTGEYGWKNEHTEKIRWATGYAVETVLAMSQIDLGLKRSQVNMPQPRIDGQNKMTKETVMYSDILRTAMEIVLSGTRLNDLSMSQVSDLNRRRSQQAADILWICHELDANPGPDAWPNEAVKIQPSRIIPDIRTLIDEGIIYSGN